MRIISGEHRGKIIHAPEDLPVRPTTDFAKTGLFNILSNQFNFHTISALDLFAGTGNISYEFISRGCRKLVAVDNNTRCVSFIRKTFDSLKAASARVEKKDAGPFLSNTEQTYDIIFADPPYDIETIADLHKIIYARNLLNRNGLFVFEHESSKDYSALRHFREKRKYGHVMFTFFQ